MYWNNIQSLAAIISSIGTWDCNERVLMEDLRAYFHIDRCYFHMVRVWVRLLLRQFGVVSYSCGDMHYMGVVCSPLNGKY